MNKLIASGAVVAASFGGFGCATETVNNTGKCVAVAESGYVMQATSYPLGSIAVRYHTGTSMTPQQNVEGSIEQDGSNYYVALESLPANLDNEQLKGDWHKNNTNAVVVISTPGFQVGLTPDCIERDAVNQYGIPAVRVNLPTVAAS
jgi:hypothetical protein